MMQVCFTVQGEPQGKGRPVFSRRGNHVVAYTPKKTRAYEALIQGEYIRQSHSFHFPEDTLLNLQVVAYYKIAKSTSKKKRLLMLERRIRPSKKPDADNILKVVADSLNKIAYKDDAQIAEMQLKKFFSEEPRLEIQLQTIE